MNRQTEPVAVQLITVYLASAYEGEEIDFDLEPQGCADVGEREVWAFWIVGDLGASYLKNNGHIEWHSDLPSSGSEQNSEVKNET